MEVSRISELLSDIPAFDVAGFALVFTACRLLLGRIPTAGARAFAEIVEAALIAVVLVFMIIQPFVMKSFYIPSGSMLPTLVDDDHIVVNKIEYRFEQPHDGDVIVFIAPKAALAQEPEGLTPDVGPTNYIKRLIADPGQTVEVRHGYVDIDRQEETHEDLRQVFRLTDHDREHVKIEVGDVAVYDHVWTRYDASQVASQFSMPGASVTFHPGQTLVNGKVIDEPYVAEDPDYDMKLVDGHSFIFDPEEGYRIDGNIPTVSQLFLCQKSPPGPVPKGYVFVMGDNRNDSNDSTRWGPLKINHIVGRASFIFWPIDRMRRIH